MPGQNDAPTTPVSDGTKVTVPEHVLSRTVESETVLLNLENEHYYGLEGVGVRFWELMAAGATFGAAVAALLEEYEVDRDTLVADLNELVADLRQHGLVLVDAA